MVLRTPHRLSRTRNADAGIRSAPTDGRAQAPGRITARAVGAAKALSVVALIAVPWLVGTNLDEFTIGLSLVILLLSLGLLVRTVGQSALCQVSFAAVGAAAFSDFTTRLHLPWLLALVLTGLITVPVGAMLAIPAVRLSRLMLAVATFGFGIVVSELFYPVGLMFGVSLNGIPTPRPALSWLGVSSDRGFYYLVLVITAGMALAVTALVRGRLGRLLTGFSDAPLAMSTHGVSGIVLLVTTFCLSAFIAAIAGALSAMAIGSTTSAAFNPYNSLTYFALILIAVGGTPWYALVAATGPTLVLACVQSALAPYYLELVFGASAIATAVVLRARRRLGQPTPFGEFRGLAGVMRPASGRAAALSAAPSAAPAPVAGGTEARQGRSLSVAGVTVRFGGVVALSDVSLQAPAGAITGLIGPNGAGKTTLFNVCSGLLEPASGQVLLDGTLNVSRMSVPRRASLGIGRSFQSPQLFESLTVEQNVALGAEAGLAGRRVLRQMWSSRADDVRVRTATGRALSACSLDSVAEAPVVTLSAGRRRVVELARCLASGFGILLLDEPSAGLDRAETREFAEILTGVVAETGIGILLVEHDMDLVMGICERIYVLDFGIGVFEGTPQEVRESAIVRRAYLGELDAPPAR
jgi:ABC-type branched-subunit amino acid transport system ATPase component/ABC-type branched-subunit amino acid transport system permease subunit